MRSRLIALLSVCAQLKQLITFRIQWVRSQYLANLNSQHIKALIFSFILVLTFQNCGPSGFKLLEEQSSLLSSQSPGGLAGPVINSFLKLAPFEIRPGTSNAREIVFPSQVGVLPLKPVFNVGSSYYGIIGGQLYRTRMGLTDPEIVRLFPNQERDFIQTVSLQPGASYAFVVYSLSGNFRDPKFALWNPASNDFFELVGASEQVVFDATAKVYTSSRSGRLIIFDEAAKAQRAFNLPAESDVKHDLGVVQQKMLISRFVQNSFQYSLIDVRDGSISNIPFPVGQSPNLVLPNSRRGSVFWAAQLNNNGTYAIFEYSIANQAVRQLPEVLNDVRQANDQAGLIGLVNQGPISQAGLQASQVFLYSRYNPNLSVTLGLLQDDYFIQSQDRRALVFPRAGAGSVFVFRTEDDSLLAQQSFANYGNQAGTFVSRVHGLDPSGRYLYGVSESSSNNPPPARLFAFDLVMQQLQNSIPLTKFASYTPPVFFDNGIMLADRGNTSTLIASTFSLGLTDEIVIASGRSYSDILMLSVQQYLGPKRTAIFNALSGVFLFENNSRTPSLLSHPRAQRNNSLGSYLFSSPLVSQDKSRIAILENILNDAPNLSYTVKISFYDQNLVKMNERILVNQARFRYEMNKGNSCYSCHNNTDFAFAFPVGADSGAFFRINLQTQQVVSLEQAASRDPNVFANLLAVTPEGDGFFAGGQVCEIERPTCRQLPNLTLNHIALGMLVYQNRILLQNWDGITILTKSANGFVATATLPNLSYGTFNIGSGELLIDEGNNRYVLYNIVTGVRNTALSINAENRNRVLPVNDGSWITVEQSPQGGFVIRSFRSGTGFRDLVRFPNDLVVEAIGVGLGFAKNTMAVSLGSDIALINQTNGTLLTRRSVANLGSGPFIWGNAILFDNRNQTNRVLSVLDIDNNLAIGTIPAQDLGWQMCSKLFESATADNWICPQSEANRNTLVHVNFKTREVTPLVSFPKGYGAIGVTPLAEKKFLTARTTVNDRNTYWSLELESDYIPMLLDLR